MVYSAEQVAELEDGRRQINATVGRLRERLLTTHLRTELGREHANHGLARRLGMLGRCIDRVSEILPPAQTVIPDQQEITDATLHIQACVFNSFGCCENLAWIWAKERDVPGSDNQPLPAKWIGLGPGYRQLRASFTPEFRAYLGNFDDWFANLKNFRDALAHRIPLYIPPFCVDPARGDEFRALDEQASSALSAGKLDTYRQLCEERDAMRHFLPVMLHSLSDPSPMLFHAQLQADVNTITDITEHLLAELA